MVGGVPQALARAQREIGLESVSMAFTQTRFGYEADRILAPTSIGRLELERRRWAFLARALRDFDVFHFNAGSSLAPHSEPRSNPTARQRVYDWYASVLELRDLPLMRRLGKAIFVTFQGSDVRQADVFRERFPVTYASELQPNAASDKRKRRTIALFDRYADGLYAATPDLLHILPDRAELLPDVTVDLRDWRPARGTDNERPLVVHAPSDRIIKGTRHVEAAVDRLRSDGVEFEFQIVEGRTRTDARRTYERADILVEQMLLGWYSVLGVELMALGKPVVTYIRPEDLALVSPRMRDELPVIPAGPETLYTVLKEWLTTRRQELTAVGHRSRAYVERWHDPLDAAARTRTAYERATGRSRTM